MRTLTQQLATGRTEDDGSADGTCHDWHWPECDRITCENFGVEHVQVSGQERPAWLCFPHAREARQQEGK